MATTITKDELMQENTQLHQLLNDVWAEVVEIDDKSSKDDAVTAAEEVCYLLNEFDPETYPIEGEDEDAEDSETNEE